MRFIRQNKFNSISCSKDGSSAGRDEPCDEPHATKHLRNPASGIQRPIFFDDAPARALAEMARVTRADGRVVLAIANFDSLACRVGRALDALRVSWLGRAPPPGRRHYDVPHDHVTRYELDLMREHASASRAPVDVIVRKGEAEEGDAPAEAATDATAGAAEAAPTTQGDE